MKRFVNSTLLTCFVLLAFLSACGKHGAAAPAQIPDPTPYPKLYKIGIPPYMPDGLVDLLDGWDAVELSTSLGEDIRIDVSSEDPVVQWVYVLAAPFYFIGDGISGEDLKAFWLGSDSDDFPAEWIFLDGSTKAVFEKIWGSAAPDHVQTISTQLLLQKTWDAENAFAILPFDEIEPSWQVIEIDGLSPIRKDFNPDGYLLNLPFSFIGSRDAVLELHSLVQEENGTAEIITNHSADRLTTVVLTGVTALVRGTSYEMEIRGYTYPAIDIGDILREADILHISNEIPFTETCPDPFANQANDANLVFCSKPEYIQLLEAIGADVVELTGDHFRDWGPDAMLTTLAMYEERGWQYYGGGYDYSDAIQPALFEHNGNKIAFLGCNAKPRGYATASESSPGAVHCDMEVMEEQVKDAVKQGYLPVFTFQHIEYYSYDASPALQVDFHSVADAGSVIVSGSQAHQPHAFEFYKSSFFHYGLGNLFFDQFGEGFSQRQAFIDRHIFYSGRHISTELIPIMFIDLARPRLMAADERTDLLNTVFTASGW